MTRPQFSRKGEAPTAKELALMAEAMAERWPASVWMVIAQRLGAVHGAVAAVEALCVVFDELGSEKVHIPTRERFFESLWRPERNGEIAAAIAGGAHPDVVALQYGLDRTRVLHIVREADAAHSGGG